MSDLRERYRAHVTSHGFTEDRAQLEAIEALQRLADQLVGQDLSLIHI